MRKKDLLEKLEDKVLIGDDCWEWTASVGRDGYGRLDKTVAHRVVYELMKGPVPEGLELDHLCHGRDATCPGGTECRHRRCVRPDHLEPVSPAVNTRRSRISAIAQAVVRCPSGHPYAEENTYTDSVGCRHCKTCRRLRMKAIRERRKSNG